MDTSKKKHSPDMRDLMPKGVMFSAEGSTGWGRKRDFGGMWEDVLLAAASPDADKLVKGAWWT